jgi:hypothetical protein
VRKFPFDTQSCEIVIGSWSLTNGELTVDEYFPEISYYTPNPTWNLNKFSVDVRNESLQRFSYFFTEDPYQNIVGTLSITRRPLFFMLNGVFPNFILNVITLLAFGLPTAPQFGLSNQYYLFYYKTEI